jgi:cob(I)alamin adenosyltransferase
MSRFEGACDAFPLCCPRKCRSRAAARQALPASWPSMNVYTRRGDDGTTALRTGERVSKDHAKIELVGAIDEAQAFLGVARAEADAFPELRTLLGELERDLWILMAEATTGSSSPTKPVPRETEVVQEMVDELEATIDRHLAAERFPTSFAVPGENRLSAALDVARTVVRRAERLAVSGALESSIARAYLNRLSDLCWVLARSVESEHQVNQRARRKRA